MQPCACSHARLVSVEQVVVLLAAAGVVLAVLFVATHQSVDQQQAGELGC